MPGTHFQGHPESECYDFQRGRRTEPEFTGTREIEDDGTAKYDSSTGKDHDYDWERGHATGNPGKHSY